MILIILPSACTEQSIAGSSSAAPLVLLSKQLAGTVSCCEGWSAMAVGTPFALADSRLSLSLGQCLGQAMEERSVCASEDRNSAFSCRLRLRTHSTGCPKSLGKAERKYLRLQKKQNQTFKLFLLTHISGYYIKYQMR